MPAAPLRAVVLLHGLHEAADDPFIDLLPLERTLAERGLVSLRFDWPADFSPRRAVREIVDRNRSFSATLSVLFDAYLHQVVAGHYADGEWIVAAHSGGGNLWYRWLVEHAESFRAEFSSMPGHAFVLAAPYQCRQQSITLPNGLRIPVREPDFDPSAIAAALPGKMVIVAGGADTTGLAEDALFPSRTVEQGLVAQYVVDDAGHRDVCSDPRTLQVIAHHLGYT